MIQWITKKWMTMISWIGEIKWRMDSHPSANFDHLPAPVLKTGQGGRITHDHMLHIIRKNRRRHTF